MKEFLNFLGLEIEYGFKMIKKNYPDHILKIIETKNNKKRDFDFNEKRIIRIRKLEKNILEIIICEF